MKKVISTIILLLYILAVFATGEVHDSLQMAAQNGSAADTYTYLKLYQKDRPEKVEAIYKKWENKKTWQKNFNYKFYDLVLDIELWAAHPDSIIKYRNKAVSNCIKNNNKFLEKYFEYKAWCYTHKKEYQNIYVKSLAFGAHLDDQSASWVRRNQLTLLAYAYAGLQKYDSAIICSQLALEEIGPGDEFYEVNLYKQLAYETGYIDDDATTYNYLNKAMNKAAKYELHYTLAHLKLMTGRLQLKREEFTSATQLLSESIAIEKDISDFKYHPISYINLGLAYRELGQVDSAQYCFNEARSFDKNKKYEGDILLNEVNILKDEKRWSEARQKLQQGLKIANNQQNIIYTAVVFEHLGDIYYNEKKYTQAITNLNKAEALFLNEKNHPRNVLDIYTRLQECYKALGQYKSAYETALKSKKAEDAFDNKSIQKAKVHFEVQQNIRDINLQLEQAQMTVGQSQKQVRKRNWLLVILALTIFLACIAVQRVLQKRKEKQEYAIDQLNAEMEYEKRRFEEIEKEWSYNLKKEISEDLHDNVLGALSGIRLLSESMQMQLAETENEELIENQRVEHEALRKLYSEFREYVDSLRHSGSVNIQSNILLEISDFIKSTLAPHNIECKVDTELESSIGQLPEELQVSIVRIVKEILNNIIKHSQASKSFAKIKWGQDKFLLSIFDDGTGFDMSTIKRKSGVQSITDRVESLGGKISFISTPGEGTLVDFEFNI